MVELKIPEVGESVLEALLAQWLKKDGEPVKKDEVLLVIETEKVTLEISAPADGILRILVHEGETVKVGTVVAQIYESEGEKAEKQPEKPGAVLEEEKKTTGPEPHGPSVPERPSLQPSYPPDAEKAVAPQVEEVPQRPIITSSVRALAEAKGVDLSDITPTGPGGRISKGDVLLHVEKSSASGTAPPIESRKGPAREERDERGSEKDAGLDAVAAGLALDETVRRTMSPIRQRIAARLLESVQNTAMLTTFNEIDMSRVQALRKQFGDQFKQKHGIRLGLMSFFIKASVAALQEIPEVNAFIEGNEILYHNYYHIGVAIGAERGLIVPVIRNAEMLGLAALEREIVDFAKKVEENRIEISDLEGGTFTITNGGVFGSLLSTPILNPPQSAILGMHKIEDRPVAVAGQVVIRPMTYVALTYDHRIIDGRQAVTFLRRIKDLVENPERIMMEV
jgi:2-oxoglutarate dehydrogenase E2 component (dihydrolipoamide succinyltransferase)